MGITAESRPGFVLEFGFNAIAPNTGLLSRHGFPSIAMNTAGKAGRRISYLPGACRFLSGLPSFCGSVINVQGKKLCL